MTVKKNTIHSLIVFPVKPSLWHVHQDADLTYRVHVTWDSNTDSDDVITVMDARGKPKVYRTIKGLMHDIRKVTDKPKVQFHLYPSLGSC